MPSDALLLAAAGDAEWLRGPAVEVAPLLLGAEIAHHSPQGTVVVRLSEVEAYQGAQDPGSHAFRGLTERNKVMFGPPGHLYTYFTYGLYWCSNVVCGPDGEAHGILLRAGQVVQGVELAWRRRYPAVPFGQATSGKLRDLGRGPARLAGALALGRDEYGLPVTTGGVVELRRAPTTPAAIRQGPRVGVAGAGGDGDAFPWRFWLEGDPTVSTYRPAAVRRRRTPSAAARGRNDLGTRRGAH